MAYRAFYRAGFCFFVAALSNKERINQIRELKRQKGILSLQFFINIYKELILACSLSILSFAILK